MAFSTRRGRPRKERIVHDTGTPELTFKRLFSITTEALDLCLERGLIDASQHWCGVHFRWLYSMRYGVPSVRALDLAAPGGSGPAPEDDPLWRIAREEEYREASFLLRRFGALEDVLGLCVHNHRPAFLGRAENVKHAARHLIERERSLRAVRQGLDQLAVLWRRKRPSQSHA